MFAFNIYQGVLFTLIYRLLLDISCFAAQFREQCPLRKNIQNNEVKGLPNNSCFRCIIKLYFVSDIVPALDNQV